MGANQFGKMDVDWHYITKVSTGRQQDLHQCDITSFLDQLMQPAVGNVMGGKLIRFIAGHEQSRLFTVSVQAYSAVERLNNEWPEWRHVAMHSEFHNGDWIWRVFRLDDMFIQRHPQHNLLYTAMHHVLAPTFQRALPMPGYAPPVIFIRCSDSPFNRHPEYHFLGMSWIRYVASSLQTNGHFRAHLISCPYHNGHNIEESRKYVDWYMAAFQDMGIHVTLQCGTVIEDFTYLVHAPELHGNESSFLWLAACGRNAHTHIYGKGFLFPEWILDHDAVKDYTDVTSVISMLSKI